MITGIQIIDLDGKIIIDKKAINRNNIDWDIRHLKKGMFVVKVKLKNGQTSVKKILK